MDETKDEPSKVADLTAERKKRVKKTPVEKFSQAELKYQIVLKMQRHPMAPREWPEFPRRFHLVRDGAGRPSILEEFGDRVVVNVIDAVVVEAIYSYCYTAISFVPGSDITSTMAKDFFVLWKSLTEPLAERPVAVAEKSRDVLTFKRLTFDIRLDDVPPDPPAYFGSFLSRCSQPEAVAAFIGSLFEPESDRQQYLFLYGPGQDGKSSIARFLFETLGEAVQSLQPKEGNDKFWNMKVYGKRLVMFTDCPDTTFFKSAEFKGLTGNDPMYFEEKGRMGFTDIPQCKVLVASNWKPDITGQKADLRRLIYNEIAPLPADTELVPAFDRLLSAEAEAIVRYCLATYRRLCPSNGVIPCELAHAVAAQNDSDDAALFERYFEAVDGAEVTGASMGRVFSHAGIRNGREKKRLREVWERMFGVTFRRSKEKNVYIGLRLKTECLDFAM